MAIYHLSAKIISRSSGRSAVASSAYRSGERLINHNDHDRVHDFTRKHGVMFSEIMLPANCPKEYADRSTLWNAVETSEKSRTAQLAREIEVAIPTELKSRSDQIDLLRSFIKKNFTDKGMIADYAIHDKGDGNPHAHIMLTMRQLDQNGKWLAKQKTVYKLDDNGQKIPRLDENGQQLKDKRGRRLFERETIKTVNWDSPNQLMEWRKEWANEVNFALKFDYVQSGIDPEDAPQIDHRSNADRGLDEIPTIHEGYKARALEANGRRSKLNPDKKRRIQSNRCKINREIKSTNDKIHVLQNKLEHILELKRLAILELIKRGFNKLKFKGIQAGMEGRTKPDIKSDIKNTPSPSKDRTPDIFDDFWDR